MGFPSHISSLSPEGQKWGLSLLRWLLVFDVLRFSSLQFSLKHTGIIFLPSFLWRDWHSRTWHSSAVSVESAASASPGLRQTHKNSIWEARVSTPSHTVSHRDRPPNRTYPLQTSCANVSAWGEKRGPELSDSTQCLKCVCVTWMRQEVTACTERTAVAPPSTRLSNEVDNVPISQNMGAITATKPAGRWCEQR